MQPRKHPRSVPSRPHYLHIDLQDLGRTDWRIPSLIKATKILNLLQSSGVMEAAQNASNADDLSQHLGDRMPLLFACQGALLGVCWFNMNHDLETKIDQHRDLAVFGEEVFEELHEAGWKLGQIQTAFVQLIERVVESFISQKEVSEKVDFLSAPTDTAN